jgi:hypothetical protein
VATTRPLVVVEPLGIGPGTAHARRIGQQEPPNLGRDPYQKTHIARYRSSVPPSCLKYREAPPVSPNPVRAYSFPPPCKKLPPV